MHSINIGVIQGLVSLGFLITWQALPPQSQIFPVLYIPLPDIYVNSFLVSLNARESLRHQIQAGRSLVDTLSHFNAIDELSSTCQKNLFR
ncbi:hypothetical protein M422DRAFT_783344 [Sphaerobolus stellatus SS14]|uniref:DUF6534 domain-containing protein n=1 Tax=Sphaerobolus stellatus (strain SS14) TaxID=990650 RepID=A0A0C9UU54_SPHS4|nr:hypothetical protein M422DRAFT_783344 [Sphaerobolus stellatus SS14]